MQIDQIKSNRVPVVVPLACEIQCFSLFGPDSIFNIYGRSKNSCLRSLSVHYIA